MRDHALLVTLMARIKTLFPLTLCTALLLFPAQSSHAVLPDDPFVFVKSGNLIALEAYIKSHQIDLDDVGPDGFTLLITAIRHGNKQIFDYLIQQGVDINKKASRDRTALMAAIAVDEQIMFQKLLRLGADVNAFLPIILGNRESIDGYYTIHITADYEFGHKYFEDLIKQGADIKQKRNFSIHDTPLSIAIICGNTENILKIFELSKTYKVDICDAVSLAAAKSSRNEEISHIVESKCLNGAYGGNP
ncbi:ankyrin repeat domain-containing protein [Magnetofaba australis]|uniref:Putative ankyrin repeat protein n=1 Tax=Magnetofaba australis IT-1 TaxID=1434232 RepID=A0A1Y2KAL8_9PROT|nr:ankyrin repeat domain-containing protein [Magnetofaba australis]OSM06855.1 putative ankyrin repeat protein [Magnetofaba australis IT-1]